jgi:molybdopterin biosynthesis enzyme
MDACSSGRQRIERLTPLASVLARIDALVAPVRPRQAALPRAIGRVLGADVAIETMRPTQTLAWRDGWALRADETLDAGPYAPAPLSHTHAVETGATLPDMADAVAPVEAVKFRGGAAEALGPIAPGDGVLPAGADAGAGEVLRRAGERLRLLDAAVLQSLGVPHVSVREPRIGILRARGGREDVVDAIVAWLARVVPQAGGAVSVSETPVEDLDQRGMVAPHAADGLILVGGTGTGSRDRSVEMLARVGQVEAHGIGLVPGETAAFGLAQGRPVLLVPGRLDAALAVWLTLGRRTLARLQGAGEDERVTTAPLARKIASPLGFAEIVLVRRTDDAVEPLASGHLPLSSLARADGWVMIPAESEGFPAGAWIEVRPLP